MSRARASIEAMLAEPRTRQIITLSVEFVLDAANISRAGGDLLDPLVFAAIVQANQAVLRNDPEIQRIYGDSGEALPDEVRRPISMHAIAQSLRLPFETVRRKVARLRDTGQVVVSRTGIYVPQAVIVGEAHAAVQSARMARLMRFHDDLARIGYLRPAERLDGPLPDTLRRTVNRALSEYLLRVTDRLAGLAGGVVEAFVLLGLAAANGEGRGPTTVRALSVRLAMPPETVRRRILALEAAGLARRAGRGWAPDAPAAALARVPAMLAEHENDLRRLLARLKELQASAST